MIVRANTFTIYTKMLWSTHIQTEIGPSNNQLKLNHFIRTALS